MKSFLHKQKDYAGGKSFLFTLLPLFKVQLFLMEMLFAMEIMIQPSFFQSPAHHHNYSKGSVKISLQGLMLKDAYIS